MDKIFLAQRMVRWFTLIACFLALQEFGIQAEKIELTPSDDDLKIEIGKTVHFDLSLSGSTSNQSMVVLINSSHPSRAEVPKKVNILPDKKKAVPVHGRGIGKSTILCTLKTTNLSTYDDRQTRVRVRVVHSKLLTVINAVIGWIYFVAWSVSFYPQVYLNWKRKSVIGLNFDFLAYNITGFIFYGLFNVGMFWIHSVQDEYFEKHPEGVNPVRANDVFFTIHAVLITFITILQCLVYDRGSQKVSLISKILVSGSWVFAAVALIVVLLKKITWLTYLYYFSYLKIGVTLIKYIPQAWMNFRRQSTSGWSIGNILLDCTGGSLSILQMFLLAYNNDDWKSLFGDFTKFGLGAISILFDVLFMVQHYCLYGSKKERYEVIPGSEDVKPYQTNGKLPNSLQSFNHSMP